MTKAELQAKYPTWKCIISEPDPECTCKGAGFRETKKFSVPCLCACLHIVEGFDRAAMTKAVGEAAKRIAGK